ncbi:uncharacterized protein LOC127247490 [Andrographis paniculata]|uniref:uncharacterized protein LOC127247490 n=1 Tax=Andrographis paniculata TaxID=175694 RepID=UPI0021E8CB9D|nr:uncharacterized protein LOC127247490 [Andrographis paniculata]
MVSDGEVLTIGRWIGRFPRGRRSSGSVLAVTPISHWIMRRRNSAAAPAPAPAPASTRKLAASLWRSAAATDGSGSVTWRWNHQSELFPSLPIPKFATEKDELRPRVKPKEERASKRRTEHDNMRSIVKNLADSIKKEKRRCSKLEVVNSKLLSNIVRAKQSSWKVLQNLEKEKKARALFENDFDELSKCFEVKRAEIGALRDHHARILHEINGERELLQMGQGWREEYVQMKLIDVSLILEDKLTKINNLIMECEAIMNPSNSTTHVNLMREAEESSMAVNSFSHGQGHYSSIVHHNNAHEIREDTRNGKQTVTRADMNSCQTPGDYRNKDSEISLAPYAHSKNITSSSCVGMPRTEGPCDNIRINERESISKRWISSTKHWLSPKQVLGKGNHNLAYPCGLVKHRNKPGIASSKKDRIQKHGSSSKLLKTKLVGPKMLVRDILEQRS